MNVCEINPYIRLATNSVLLPYTHIKRRIIFDYELLCVEKGEFTLKYNDIAYHPKRGDIILLCPDVSHSFRLGKEEVSQPHIHFDMVYDSLSESIPISFKDKKDMSEEEKKQIRKNIFIQSPEHPFVKFRDTERFFTLWRKIIGNNTTDYLTKKAALTEIISMLISDNYPEAFSENKGTDYNVAVQIKDYIDAGQGINSNLDDFEKQFSYSKYYLERQFKKTYNVSLIAYRNNKKMELAAELLKRESVTSVVNRLHFTSIYSFSRSFKKHFGVSPTEHKNQHRI